MLKIGYLAPMEQYQPLTLLDYTSAAEDAGFDSIWVSDHFHPWFHTKAAGAFAWVWMAAAAERTRRVEIGTAVTCPILRYNPAIIAQAFATLRCMYPDRIFLGLGTGEAMNEVPVGCKWPPFAERAERLEESIKVMKLLWSRKFVTFEGKYYKLKKANLYTKPASPPPLFVASTGSRVAEIAGRYADGLLTVPLPEERYRDVIFPAMERGAKSAGRNPRDIEKAIEIFVAYDEDYDRALEAARVWAAAPLPFLYKFEIFDPREIERIGSYVGDKQFSQYWMIATDPEDHIKHLEKFLRIGFRNIHVESSSPDEIKTIKMYEKDVLPYIRSTYGDS